jgi:hypothetical protein
MQISTFAHTKLLATGTERRGVASLFAAPKNEKKKQLLTNSHTYFAVYYHLQAKTAGALLLKFHCLVAFLGMSRCDPGNLLFAREIYTEAVNLIGNDLSSTLWGQPWLSWYSVRPRLRSRVWDGSRLRLGVPER